MLFQRRCNVGVNDSPTLLQFQRSTWNIKYGEILRKFSKEGWPFSMNPFHYFSFVDKGKEVIFVSFFTNI